VNSAAKKTLHSPLAALLLAACLLAPPALLFAQNAGPSFSELEESLTCQCGCGLTVHSCNHLQCPSAIPLRAEIREQMALGSDKATILAYFGEKYGEKILSSPTTQGFNLLAWTLPFVAVAIGALLIVMLVRGWAGKRKVRPAGPQTGTPAPAASPYKDVLEKELRELED